jgi:flagellar biosynthesis protein FlhG
VQSFIDSIRDAERPRPCIWAIGGGKGGVGKSVITSSLGIAMARHGQRCVVVDADLGAANLHTVLGVRQPHRTLAHFLNNEVRSLSEVLCPGPVPNLWLISGSDAPSEMANPRYSRKEKLLRAIRCLDVDHVFLDLGAGSAFNVLDFFLAAPRGILVVVPEPTSIENAYHFLKAAFLRALRKAAKQSTVRETINRALGERAGRFRSPRELLSSVMELDPHTGMILQAHADTFAPMLILNQVRTIEQRRIGLDISLATREYLGTEIEYIGALAHDECVCDAVGERTPVLQRFPASQFSRDLETIVERLQTKKRLTPSGSPGAARGTARRLRSLYDRDETLATYGLLNDPQVPTGTERVEPEDPSRPRRERCQVERAPQVGAEVAAPPPLPPLDLREPGAYLRRCREHLGLGLAELERRTRILCLGSIEEEDFGRVPPEPFIRGFVVSCARALGIADARAVAARFVARYRVARVLPVTPS